MGLDISVRTDNENEIWTPDDHKKADEYWLSRSFCNFMCRQNVIDGEPELNQIGRITGVDIQPFYEMETYSSDEDAMLWEEFTGQASGETSDNEMTDIDKVLTTVNELIRKLSLINDLPALLNDYGHDTLGYAEYFGNFNADNTGSYVHNNFGQDLRSMKRFLEYVKSKGAQSVYFSYG